MAIIGLVNLPSMAMLGWALWSFDPEDAVAWVERLETVGRIDVALGTFTGVLAAGAISFGVIQDLHGDRPGIGAWLSNGLVCMPRILWISLLSSLAITVGMVLLIVPGLIALTMFCVSPVVGVVERLGGAAALQRAAALSEDHRMRIFVAYFALGLLSTAPTLVATRWMSVPQVTLELTVERITNGMVGVQLLSLVGAGLLATLPAVLYHALRTAKEGVDPDSITRVFD